MRKIGHYPVKNAFGGSFCKKCFDWSNMPDGLKNYECFASKEEAKQNIKVHRRKIRGL